MPKSLVSLREIRFYSDLQRLTLAGWSRDFSNRAATIFWLIAGSKGGVRAKWRVLVSQKCKWFMGRLLLLCWVTWLLLWMDPGAFLKAWKNKTKKKPNKQTNHVLSLKLIGILFLSPHLGFNLMFHLGQVKKSRRGVLTNSKLDKWTICSHNS